MKVVLCVCLVALVEAAPTIVEKVKQQEFNQPQDFNQPLAYNQPLASNQPLDYNQLLAYNQALDYNQLRAYNQPLDYNQQLAYNQHLANQPLAYNQPLDYNQQLAYNQHLINNQPLAYNQPLDNQYRAYNQPLEYNQLVDYNQRLPYPRGRRSNQVAVVSPCAAASMPYSSYYSHGYSPYSYIHPGRVYRADEEQETMSFSDADQMENARSYYETPSGLAYGVFPNANTGGCGMPLLVSCSPQVVQGRMVKAEPHAPVNYRLQDHPETPHDHPAAEHDTKTTQ